MDLAHLYTEKQLEKIEKRFAKEYKQAEKEVSAKLKAYLDGFAKREAKMLEKVANGEISYQRYTQWRIGQVAVGERWKKLRDELAEAYTKATVRNTQDIEAMLEDIFAESANRTMFSIEKGANVDTSFTLYDQNTVNRLIEEQPNLLPKPRVKIAKDKKWNQKKITSAVTQGILQGDSMGQIAKRMRGEISKGFSIEDVKDWQSKPMDKAMKELSRKISQSAIRNARTAVTGAENAGRLRGYEDAQDMGIKLQQQWVATLDNRTRHEHRELDGQIRDIDEPFEVDGDEIMYPADPSAEPHLVYNCRCTTIAVVEGHPIDLDVRDTSVIGDYEEWKNGKKKEVETPQEEKPNSEDLPELNTLKKSMKEEDYKEYYDIINNNPIVKSAYNDYSDDVSFRFTSGTRGWYTPSIRTVNYGYSARKGKYSTLAHEFGHAVDDIGKGDFKATFKEADTIHDKSNVLRRFFPKVPSSSDEYLGAMEKDKAIMEKLLASDEERLKVIMDDKSHGLQDFADGLAGARTKGLVYWGHGEKYYNRKYNDVKSLKKTQALKEAYNELGYDASNQAKVKALTRRYETASELWANQMDALTNGGKALEYMEKYAPNTLEMLKKLLKERKKK